MKTRGQFKNTIGTINAYPEHLETVYEVFMECANNTLFQIYFTVRKQAAKRKVSTAKLVQALSHHWTSPMFCAFWTLGGSRQFRTKERWEQWLEEMLDLPKIDLTPAQVSKIYDDIAAAEAGANAAQGSSASSTQE